MTMVWEAASPNISSKMVAVKLADCANNYARKSKHGASASGITYGWSCLVSYETCSAEANPTT
jgi:hypothetical protein